MINQWLKRLQFVFSDLKNVKRLFLLCFFASIYGFGMTSVLFSLLVESSQSVLKEFYEFGYEIICPLSIILSPFMFGYLYELIQINIQNNQKHQLPSWKNWEAYYLKGLSTAILSFFIHASFFLLCYLFCIIPKLSVIICVLLYLIFLFIYPSVLLLFLKRLNDFEDNWKRALFFHDLKSLKKLIQSCSQELLFMWIGYCLFFVLGGIGVFSGFFYMMWIYLLLPDLLKPLKSKE